MLPDLSGPLAQPQSTAFRALAKALLLPPERFRELVLRQIGTWTIIDAEHGTSLWWHRPPVATRSALRHSFVAVPFWFALLALADRTYRLGRNRVQALT